MIFFLLHYFLFLEQNTLHYIPCFMEKHFLHFIRKFKHSCILLFNLNFNIFSRNFQIWIKFFLLTKYNRRQFLQLLDPPFLYFFAWFQVTFNFLQQIRRVFRSFHRGCLPRNHHQQFATLPVPFFGLLQKREILYAQVHSLLRFLDLSLQVPPSFPQEGNIVHDLRRQNTYWFFGRLYERLDSFFQNLQTPEISRAIYVFAF